MNSELDLARGLLAIAHHGMMVNPSIEASHDYLLAMERYQEAKDDLGFYPTHVHKGTGGTYQLLDWPFRWEPEWDRPAVLYRSDRQPDLLIGRFKDVFDDRFFATMDGK